MGRAVLKSLQNPVVHIGPLSQVNASSPERTSYMDGSLLDEDGESDVGVGAVGVEEERLRRAHPQLPDPSEHAAISDESFHL